jgi:cytochrome d ubiquinol oxidase subunit II
MDAAGYHGSLLGLLNPYGLVTGALFVLLFLVHGALYLSVKTTGPLAVRAAGTASALWPALLLVAATFLVHTYFATRLFDNFLAHPALFLLPLAAVAALVAMRVLLARGEQLAAFAASCVTILLVVGTGVTGLFPNLIPSSLDPAYSLTIFNSSSSPYTLGIMTAVALVFVPIVIAYKIWVYRIFRAPVSAEETLADGQSY